MLDSHSLGIQSSTSTDGILGCHAAERLVRELAQGKSLKGAAAKIEFPYKKALRAITAAEKRVGFKLVEPGQRGYHLTDFGILLVKCLNGAL